MEGDLRGWTMLAKAVAMVQTVVAEVFWQRIGTYCCCQDETRMVV